MGYSNGDDLIVRGRVSASSSLKPLKTLLARFGKAGARTTSFLTRKVTHIEIRCGDASTRTDEKGYFKFSVPRVAATAELFK